MTDRLQSMADALALELLTEPVCNDRTVALQWARGKVLAYVQTELGGDAPFAVQVADVVMHLLQKRLAAAVPGGARHV